VSGSSAVRAPDFGSVTEQPLQGATRMQMAMARSRYGWAAERVSGKDVIEVACGAGLGLGWLAERAQRVEAGDIDEQNCRIAWNTYRGDSKVCIRRMDAQDLPFVASCFDVALLFEALYYLSNVRLFLSEARRVLRPGGVLLISTVNCEWRGFHPSPLHTRYWTGTEVLKELDEAGFEAQLLAGFKQSESGRGGLRNWVRSLAARAGWIPRTMRAKAVLKRIFYGRLERIPYRLGPRGGLEQMVPVHAGMDLTEYRYLYFECRGK
jgi:2-polyprenyl-3-methyl-5-hydroxy-6-metoxy-1,4-benzoquinol methylase